MTPLALRVIGWTTEAAAASGLLARLNGGALSGLSEVILPSLPLERFRSVMGEQFAEIEPEIARARAQLAGRVVWHVNSTARGGGVAEMLRSYLAYARGAGVDVRWVVIPGDPQFFEITKRLHNHLHGNSGDGGPLGAAEHHAYERGLAPAAEALAKQVRAGDVVYLHDPQTAGLVSSVHALGAAVIWRCHVGDDGRNELVHGAWDFLRPDLGDADALVFSRRQFVWEGLEDRLIWIMAPTIDAFSPKNQEMAPKTVTSMLATIGLGPGGSSGVPTFQRADGTPARVDRRADIVQESPLPAEAPTVAQVSRWDHLKDPLGVLR